MINNDEGLPLLIKGEEAGDMIAYIYGDDTTRGLNEVYWEDFQINAEQVLKEILIEADKWNVKVYLKFKEENIKLR